MSVIKGKYKYPTTSGWIIIFITLLFELGPSGGHEIVKFVVPILADPRENAKLICQYNMGIDQLYSAKWFKGDHEIFRYMPEQDPDKLSFPSAGVQLAKHPHCSMFSCDIELTNITKLSEGLYRCEVSSEAPTFLAIYKESKMLLGALPQRDPRVDGLASRYSLGDEIKVNCTSDPSLPAANLTWFVNDRAASFFHMEGPWENHSDPKGLMSRTLLLRLVAERGLFRESGREGGVLKIQCIADLPLSLPVTQLRRQTTLTTSLEPSTLTNEKLAWPGNGALHPGSNLRIVLIHIALLMMVRSIINWRPCGIHLSKA